MMLFLCSHSNATLFDWLNDSSLVAQPFMLKKISSNQLDLCSFAKKEAMSINYYKYLAIDLEAVTNDIDSFRTSLQSINMMNPKIKFLFVDIGDKAQMLQDVVKSFGDIPLVSTSPEKDITEFKAQVTACLQHTPIKFETEKEKIINSNGSVLAGEKQGIVNNPKTKEYIFENQDVMIAVINAYPRAGATTLSINIASYLHSIGASVAYIECNSDLDHLEKICNNTSGFTVVKEKQLERNGVIYMKNLIPEGMDFVINDMSRVIQDGSETNALEFIGNCNTVILCGTSKPYELQEIKEKVKILEDRGCKKINICLAFTPENVKAHLLDIFGEKNVNVYFTGYTPDMFRSNVNGEMISRIFKDYIKEKANDKMLKIF